MTTDPNLPLLEEAASKLRSFLNEIVFVGGVTLGLLVTDKAGAPIRETNDVDVIAEILTYPDYIAFSERLLNSGFVEDTGEKPLACRWRNGHLILDVLPLDEKVLGYTNRWYQSALRFAQPFTLPSGLLIQVVSAPFFLGTKMEAFRGRGKNDFVGSHDLEDFVAVIDGRSTVLTEISQAPPDLRQYLAVAARGLLQEPRFLQVVAERAEKAAVIVTTNLPFSEWPAVFTNARLCKAMLDRLTDQAHIIETGSESYRFRRTLNKKARD